MDALDLLRSDHQRLEKLCRMAEKSACGTEKREVFEEIRRQVRSHAQIEKTAFYHAFAGSKEQSAFLQRAFDEHQRIETLISRAERASDAESCVQLIDELVSAIRAHVATGESVHFEKIRMALSPEELRKLAILLTDPTDEVLPEAA